MIDVELSLLEENGNPITFMLQPDVIIGYETCAWSTTGKRTILRLTFDAFHEWTIDVEDKTAVHVISNLVNGMQRHSYKFINMIIK